jgi:hypothetical protein
MPLESTETATGSTGGLSDDLDIVKIIPGWEIAYNATFPIWN